MIYTMAIFLKQQYMHIHHIDYIISTLQSDNDIHDLPRLENFRFLEKAPAYPVKHVPAIG